MKNTVNPIGQLSEERRKLYERLLEKAGVSPQSTPSIPRRVNPGPAPASYAQQRMWFIDQITPDISIYVFMSPFLLTGPLNIKALVRGLNSIVKRHEVLRTRFETNEREVVQIIEPELELDVPLVDLQDLTQDERQSCVRGLIAQEKWHAFNLRTGPLMRATLVKNGEEGACASADDASHSDRRLVYWHIDERVERFLSRLYQRGRSSSPAIRDSVRRLCSVAKTVAGS